MRDALLVFEDVLADHLLHSSFWFFCLRMLLRPSRTNLHCLYTSILPHLNAKPLLHNWLLEPTEGAPPCPRGAGALIYKQTAAAARATADGGDTKGSRGGIVSLAGDHHQQQQQESLQLRAFAAARPSSLGGFWLPSPVPREAGSAVAAAEGALYFLLR